MAKKTTDTQKTESQFVVAKETDGTIQITFTIPWNEINERRNKALEELGKDIEVAGFRKGKAPIAKVAEKVSFEKLIERTLAQVIPGILAEAITKDKLKIAIYPKFELIKAKDNEDWQVRAITCEIPEIDLGDYKNDVKRAISGDIIWTPGKDLDKDRKEITQAEKEQKIIEVILKSVKVTIPRVLIDEEINIRLSKLLERLEKLGLNLDSYLSSIGKTADSIRSEYAEQAKQTISLELILTKIAEKEAITIDPKDVDKAIEAGKSDPTIKENIDTPEQRNFLESILKRRKALDLLNSLS